MFGLLFGSGDILLIFDIGFWFLVFICLKWEIFNFKKNLLVVFKDFDKVIRFVDLCLYYFWVCILILRNNFYFVDVVIIMFCWIFFGFGYVLDLSYEWINCSIII